MTRLSPISDTALAADGFETLLRKVMFLAFEAGKHTLEGHGFPLARLSDSPIQK